MSDTKAVIVFIALSAVLLIGIDLLPKSVPTVVPETATTAIQDPVQVTQTYDPATVKTIPAGSR